MSSLRILLVAALALYTAQVHGFWRLECEGSLGQARLDPLMSFDTVGDHVHSIKGGSAFGPTSKADDLLDSNCTSCGVSQDMSAYWAPAMYFQHDDGTVELVPEKPPHKSYYLLYTGLTHEGKQQKVEAFPNGFQMIAGNNFNRNSTLPDPDSKPLGPWPDESQEQLAQRALGFNCLHYAAGNDEPTLMRHEMPDKDFLDSTCTDGLRLEVQFPSCWDGQSDGGPSHKAHVAYPDGVSVGNCPKGFDRRLITLFYETIVATDEFKGKAGQFVLANGDPTGYGYHGDFISAWKDKALEKAVQSCNQPDGSGMMSDCAVFEMTQESQQCKFDSPLPGLIAKENVKGPMRGLANGLKVAYGPGPAPRPRKPKPASVDTGSTGDGAQDNPPSLSSPAVPSPMAQLDAKLAAKPSSTAERAGANPVVVQNKVAVIDTAALPAITPPPSSTPGLQPGQQILTTSYVTEGNTVRAIVKVMQELPGTTEFVYRTVVQDSNGHDGAHLRRHVHHRYVHKRGVGERQM